MIVTPNQMNSMTEKELRELDAWICINVFGWQERNDYHGSKKLDTTFWVAVENGSLVSYRTFRKFTTDRSEAMMLLEKCAEKMPRGIVGIGSPMFDESVASSEKRQTQGWIVGKIGKPSNFDVEAPTLPLAICLFAKTLFTK